MNAIGTKLKDTYIITTKIFEDKRGSFIESFNLLVEEMYVNEK